MKFAGFFARFIAYLIDGVAIGFLAWLVALVMGGAVGITAGTGSGFLNFISGTLALLTIVIMALFQFLYFGYMWSRDGQSFGMKLMNMKVVEQGTEGPISFLRGGLRGTIGYWISSIIFGLGFIWAAFDSNKEGWHDKIFNTWVVAAR